MIAMSVMAVLPTSRLAPHAGSYSAIMVLETGPTSYLGGLYLLPQFCKALDLRPGAVLFHRCAMLCCAVLCCVVLCRAVPCRAVLCRAVLCRAVPCCAVLCCAVLELELDLCCSTGAQADGPACL